MSDEFKWPDPSRIACVKAAPGSDLLNDWPILFSSGNSGEDFDDWGLCTDSVRGSELMACDFPTDAKSDAQFIAELINAYRRGELVRKGGA
jgi:hypothetical protein